MILQGALVHGFPSNAWTCTRAAALIETTFGLTYTADHVGVMMKELGLSPQKPDKRPCPSGACLGSRSETSNATKPKSRFGKEQRCLISKKTRAARVARQVLFYEQARLDGDFQ